MAIMCPIEENDYFQPESNEQEMYRLLQTQLDDDFYVFHSFRMLDVDAGLVEHEADFVVFHQKLGLLFIEAKNTRPRFENQTWYYGSGIKMEHGGPYVQASVAMHQFVNMLGKNYRDKGAEVKRNCKILSCVWFPLVARAEIERLSLPSNASGAITITKDDHENLQACIEQIMSRPLLLNGYQMETAIDNEMKNFLLDNVLCPKFELTPLPGLKLDNYREAFHSLLKEQVRLLNYLEEQRSAAINGRAGTGKTVMALEKAKRHANEGDRVLFLVYNAKLADWLKKNYSEDYPNIKFTTAGALVREMAGEEYVSNNRFAEGYSKVALLIEEGLNSGTFPYRHVVIDEGQDFYQPGLADIPNKFQEWIELYDDSEPVFSQLKTFYVFYDKNQLVQGKEGKCSVAAIDNADCKLTLYINCRNTMEIAQTADAMLKKGLGEGKFPKGKVKSKSIKQSSQMFIVKSHDEAKIALDQTIQECIADGIEDIQILTCTHLDKSSLHDFWQDTRYGNDKLYRYSGKEIPVTTALRFKGLEADVIILTDFNPSLFNPQQGSNSWETAFSPYVGTSRARLRLIVIANMTEEECKEALEKMGKLARPQYEPKVAKQIFNAKYNKLLIPE